MDPSEQLSDNPEFQPGDSLYFDEVQGVGSQYAPGLVLQPNEDPSSYNYASSIEVNTNPEGSIFDIESLPQESIPEEPESPISRFLPYLQYGKSKKRLLIRYIRTLRKSMRHHDQRQYPTRSLHRVTTSEQRRLWQRMLEYYDSVLRPQVPSEWVQISGTDIATHWRVVLQRFFELKEMRVYNFLFCELVFASGPRELCERLRLRCCRDSSHSSQCSEKWSQLKRYLQVEIALPAATASEELREMQSLLL